MVCSPEFVLHNERCYWFSNQSAPWSEARTLCNNKGIGYDLVVIRDENENKFLKQEIESRFKNEEFWIGLKMILTNDTYIWVDKSSLVFGSGLGRKPWKIGEPNSVIKSINLYTLWVYRALY